jgi:small subunit ribosomal protein S19
MATRSTWKGPFIREDFFQEIFSSDKNTLKTTSRNSSILPCLIGKVLHIHNGKFFIPITVTDDMLGHKLGAFVPTRLRHVYKNKIKNKNK